MREAKIKPFVSDREVRRQTAHRTSAQADGVVPPDTEKLEAANLSCCIFQVGKRGEKPCACAISVHPIAPGTATLWCTYFNREIDAHTASSCPQGPIEQKTIRGRRLG